MAASTLSAVLGLQLGAFGVVLETVASGITALPFSTFVLLMQPIHLAIGLVEGMQGNLDVLETLVNGQEEQIKAIDNTLTAIKQDLKELQNSKDRVDVDINTLKNQIVEQIKICQKQLTELSND